MTPHQILGLIQNCARQVLPALGQHQLEPHESLADLGATSMDRVEIVIMVLEELALDIPRVETFGPKNVGELAALLHEKLRAA